MSQGSSKPFAWHFPTRTLPPEAVLDGAAKIQEHLARTRHRATRWVFFDLSSEEEINKQVSAELPWDEDPSAIFLVVALAHESKPICAERYLELRNALLPAADRSVLLSVTVHETTDYDYSCSLREQLELRRIFEQPINNEGTIAVGRRVRLGEYSGASAYEVGLLTINPSGSMSVVLDHLDRIRAQWADAIANTKQGSVSNYQKAVLQRISRGDGKKPSLQCPGVNRDDIPRVLLLGESGSGKTLVANYLSRRGERDGNRVARIALPSYLGAEDRFEYELFGHTVGAFTGADSAKIGLLLENLSGTVFLDEFGDCNETLQAKLLAFMDDYRVRPVGHAFEDFYCPLLIVAATNHFTLDDCGTLKPSGAHRESAHLRHDLFERFTHIIEVPSLRDRLGEVEYIIDALLQSPAINSTDGKGRGVEAFTEAALTLIKQTIQDDLFKESNFRLLERILRLACANARWQGSRTLARAHVLAAFQETGRLRHHSVAFS